MKNYKVTYNIENYKSPHSRFYTAENEQAVMELFENDMKDIQIKNVQIVSVKIENESIVDCCNTGCCKAQHENEADTDS